MSNVRVVIITLFVLILSTEFTNAQQIKRIPLKQGIYMNPAFQLDGLTIEPINLYIRPELRDWRDEGDCSLQLELDISNQSEELLIEYYEEDIKLYGPYRNTFPRAFEKYLFDLDIRKDGVDLLIRPLRSGDEFIIDDKSGVTYVVDSLTITYLDSAFENLITVENKYSGYKVRSLFTVSDGEDLDTLNFRHVYSVDGDEIHDEEFEQFKFLYYDYRDETQTEGSIQWKNYRIEIMDGFEPPKLRVTKLVESKRYHLHTQPLDIGVYDAGRVKKSPYRVYDGEEADRKFEERLMSDKRLMGYNTFGEYVEQDDSVVYIREQWAEEYCPELEYVIIAGEYGYFSMFDLRTLKQISVNPSSYVYSPSGKYRFGTFRHNRMRYYLEVKEDGDYKPYLLCHNDESYIADAYWVDDETLYFLRGEDDGHGSMSLVGYSGKVSCE